MKIDFAVLKFYLLMVLVSSNFCWAQDLVFATPYFEAVDRWVVFPKKNNESSYVFGFIYIDQQAGFTFQYKSRLIATENGLKIVESGRLDSLVIKKRLPAETSHVMILNQKQVSDLGLPDQPEWLTSYKKDEGTVSYLKNLGWHFNHVGASSLAIPHLLDAYQQQPHYEGLEFELGFAYNATSQFDMAIEILEKAIEKDPMNSYLYRELGFSLKNVNLVERAEAVYRKGIELSKDDFEKSEMAINMAQSYFLLRNRRKFDKWAKLTKKYSEKGSTYAKAVEAWSRQWPTN